MVENGWEVATKGISCAGSRWHKNTWCVWGQAPEGKEADEVGSGLKAWLRWLGVALAGAGGSVGAVNRWAGQGRVGQGRAVTLQVKLVCRRDQLQGLAAGQEGRRRRKAGSFG